MIMTTIIKKFINIACRNLFAANRLRVNRSSIRRFYAGSLYLLLGLSVTFSSCKSGTTASDETPTRGNIKIIADESFQPLIDTEVFTFTQLYINAKIKPKYKPEYDVINDFMNDSVKVIVTSKRLTDDQIKYLRDSLIIARTISFAWDALALVTNKKNNDTLINYNDVRDIFLGSKTNWKDLDPKSKLGGIRVIFDNTKSGNIRYFKELFEIANNLPSNFFAVNTNAEVIDFVSRNPDALGIVSKNWISDKDDPQSMSYIKKINVVGVSRQYINDGSYYRPDQGFIYDKSYPFVREIFLITRETFNGLGSGFIQWATAEQGQRIVLKSGLVPATMPIRLVQIKTE
jgi:phosphate transport system substrate-binding protein